MLLNLKCADQRVPSLISPLLCTKLESKTKTEPFLTFTDSNLNSESSTKPKPSCIDFVKSPCL